jgi:hypothetical protein
MHESTIGQKEKQLEQLLAPFIRIISLVTGWKARQNRQS